MAISWGSYVNNGSGNGMRLGYEFSQSPSSVGSGTSSVTVTVRIYVETKASVSDSTNTFSWSGSFGSGSASPSISHGGGGGVTLLRTMSRTVSTSYSGTVSSSISASLNGINAISGTCSVSGSHSTARRPYSAPSAVSNVVSVRSGTSIKTSWKRNPTTARPYDSIRIERQTNDGSWGVGNDISGGSTSYNSTGLSPNSEYQYRVRAENSAGASPWVYGSQLRIPPNSPDAPSNANVSRSSDTRQIVTWTRGTSTSTAPISNHEVSRKDISTDEWKTIATVSGSVSSYTDSSTRSNRQYQYRVRSKNAGGTSSWVYTDYMSTTPNPPTNVVAKKQGEDIRLTWSNTTGTRITAIEVWLTAAGVDQTPVYLQLSGSPTSWTHTSPDPTKTWQYRLKTQSGADSNDAAPNLYSAFSARSNTVQLIAPPSAPTGLAPSGTAVDALDDQRFGWQHNPVDTTDQTAYEMQYRVDSGAWVNTGKVLSADQFIDFASETFANNTTVEWQVRTWGAHATASAWSALAVVTMSARPAVTIIYPSDSGEAVPVVNSSSLNAQWEYFDPEDTTQTSVRLRLEDANGSPVWSQTLNMAGTSYEIPYTLTDGGSYTLVVSVRDASGLWSYESAQPFDVTYAKPPTPTIEALWDLNLGGVVISYEHPAPLQTIDYMWAGTADNSDSIRTDGGVEYARNLAPDPRATTPALYRSTGTVATGTIGGVSCLKATRATAGSMQVVVDKKYFADVEGFSVGDKIYWSVDVWVTVPMNIQLIVLFYGGANEDTDALSTAQTPAQGWVRHYGVSTITATPAGGYFEYRIHNQGTAVPDGEGFYFRNLSIQKNQDIGYFDGDFATVPGEAEAVSADLQHSADGEEWTTIAAGLEPTTSTVDFIPILDTVNYYRLISYSALPSSLESAPVPVVVESKGWVFVNGGPDWSVICRIRDNVQTDHSPKRARTLNHFAGRQFAVMTSGESRDRTVAVSGRTSGGGSTDREWQVLYDDGEPVCYREPGPAYGGSGDRFTASFQEYSRQRQRIFEEVSLTFERVEEV